MGKVSARLRRPLRSRKATAKKRLVPRHTRVDGSQPCGRATTTYVARMGPVKQGSENVR